MKKSNEMISVVIPTLNEAKTVPVLIKRLIESDKVAEVMIVDSPHSSDNMSEIAAGFEKVSYHISSCGGRAVQLNFGGYKAFSEILYFVHADTFPPKKFAQSILNAVENGHDFGFFSYRFDTNHILLKFNAWVTHFRNIFEGGGDQSLFIKKDLFRKFNGYDENYVIMEDFDFVRRLKKSDHLLKLIKDDMIVSSRKYYNNHYLKVNMVNAIMFVMFKLRISPVKLKKTYDFFKIK